MSAPHPAQEEIRAALALTLADEEHELHRPDRPRDHEALIDRLSLAYYSVERSLLARLFDLDHLRRSEEATLEALSAAARDSWYRAVLPLLRDAVLDVATTFSAACPDAERAEEDEIAYLNGRVA